MSETPEVIEAEIAALQEKLAEAQHASTPPPVTAVVEVLGEHSEIVETIGEPAETIEAQPIAAAPVHVPAPAHPAPHAAQTIPARWALQPLER